LRRGDLEVVPVDLVVVREVGMYVVVQVVDIVAGVEALIELDPL